MGYCPFQSGPMFDSSGSFTSVYEVQCPQDTTCQVWDSTNNRCGAQVSDTIVDESANGTDTLITLLEAVLGSVADKGGESESLYTIERHIHDGHWHNAEQHGVDEFSVEGSIALGSTVPQASILINEYMGNEDLDANSAIYGFDFMIQDSAEKPPMLTAIESNPSWTDPPSAISWEDYLDSIG